MKNTLPNFSIVIPVYNEANVISQQIRKLVSELEKQRINDWELILVENGSNDQTKEVAKKNCRQYPKVKLIILPKAEYGAAIKEGIKNSVYPFIVLFNIDYWSITFLRKSLIFMKSNPDYDIVLASKTHDESTDKRPLQKKVITKFFNKIILQKIFKYPGTDTHGIKTFRKTILPLMKNCYSKHFIFDTELLLKAKQNKFKIKEFPIKVKELRKSPSNIIRRIRITIIDLSKIIFKAK